MTRQLCRASPSQGDNEFDVVPESDLVVARTAHRDNKSDYYVDGRKSSFGAVTTLLKGKGIDLDNNRFLILQVTAARWAKRLVAAAESPVSSSTCSKPCERPPPKTGLGSSECMSAEIAHRPQLWHDPPHN
jgi:hypothetical protein